MNSVLNAKNQLPFSKITKAVLLFPRIDEQISEPSTSILNTTTFATKLSDVEHNLLASGNVAVT